MTGINNSRTIHGRTLAEWQRRYPLISELMALHPTVWFNPAVVPVSQALTDMRLSAEDVADASARLKRFAPYLAVAFPETAAAGGLIESDLIRLERLQPVLVQDFLHQGESTDTVSDEAVDARLDGADPIAEQVGALWLKADHALPISGSIKARGGIHAVLKHAETLALNAGLIAPEDDYIRLNGDEARAFFGQYRLAVGSTGNLGLSIGLMGATLGFKVVVHMAAAARDWKKQMLREHGVEVHEYTSDYSAAVAEGRRQAVYDPWCHFIDDENSVDLFLGYAVAAERLAAQFEQADIVVDMDHPLFVYLPCGVGGGPGGVAFGLKLIYGDAVHCVFAEPTHSPAMLLGVYTGLHDQLGVQEFGIDNLTVADGLAVGRASGLVGRQMQRLIDGYYTVSDETLMMQLCRMYETEGIKLEPSAAAGIPGFASVLRNTGYRARIGLTPERARAATHLIWATGGSMVPDEVFAEYLRAD